MNLTLTIPESEQPPITVTGGGGAQPPIAITLTVGGAAGGTAELTSYVAQVAGLPDYPATFPPDLTGVTPAAIATALNAGTEDATAADTDKIAITHPAGGWMLLSTLWTWITTKLGALPSITAGGAWSFSSTTRPTSAATTDTLAAANASSLITKGDGDARYGPTITKTNASQLDSINSGNVAPTTITELSGTVLEANTLYRCVVWGRITCIAAAGYALRLVSNQDLVYNAASGLAGFTFASNGSGGSGFINFSSARYMNLHYRINAAATEAQTVAHFFFRTGENPPTLDLQIYQQALNATPTSWHSGGVVSFEKIA